jgi:hypothetical protein
MRHVGRARRRGAGLSFRSRACERASSGAFPRRADNGRQPEERSDSTLRAGFEPEPT